MARQLKQGRLDALLPACHEPIHGFHSLFIVFICANSWKANQSRTTLTPESHKSNFERRFHVGRWGFACKVAPHRCSRRQDHLVKNYDF